MNDLAKNILLWVVIAIVLLTVFQSFGPTNRQESSLDYSTFLDIVETGGVSQVTFEGQNIQGVRASGEQFVTYLSLIHI